MILLRSESLRISTISPYVVPTSELPTASTFRTKSPGLMPNFRACPGLSGPPSTNLVTRQLTDSISKPTGPGDKYTVLSVGLSLRMGENNDNLGRTADSSKPIAVDGLDL